MTTPRMSVACVLRSGGDFTPAHVRALYDGVRAHWPEDGPFLDFLCLTDTPIGRYGIREAPLVGRWPGWWSKMEICRPDVEGPLLYLDLDTVVVGDPTPLMADASRSVVLRDLFRGRRRRKALQSAFMLLTDADRARVWETWVDEPKRWMRLRGDQMLFERVLADRVAYVQDTHPGHVVGYKSDLARGTKAPPKNARIVIFHGRPRPWETDHAWVRGATGAL